VLKLRCIDYSASLLPTITTFAIRQRAGTIAASPNRSPRDSSPNVSILGKNAVEIRRITYWDYRGLKSQIRSDIRDIVPSDH
jgi:hypothetical protein